MKCLTFDESREWLDMAGVRIDENRALFPNDPRAKPSQILMVDFPKETLKLNYLSSRLVQWLPNGHTRMLWLKYWNTYPLNQITLFEKVRHGCGEHRHIIDARGHLFNPFSGDADGFYEDEESSVLSGLVFLTMGLDWRGYLLARDCSDYIMLDDEYLAFHSANEKKLTEATLLAETFGLSHRRHNLE